MSIEKIKNPLQKILNRLNSLEENDQLSRLDRDYITHLMIEAYDQVNARGQAGNVVPDATKHEIFEFEEDIAEPQPPQKEVKENIQPAPQPKQEVKSPNGADKPQPATQAEETVEKEIIQEEQKSAKEEPKEDKDREEENKEEKEPVAESISTELKQLFQLRESTELSERLSQMPINDIWNAMGLNERIFTQNELFRGDQEAFRTTVQSLNQMSSYEEAKQKLMEGAAREYDWAEEGRQNIARNFIRLVKRKYK